MKTIDIGKYIRSHYGTCSAEKCTCMVYGWLGEHCEYWNSCNANTYEQLLDWQLIMIKERKIETE